MTTTERQSTCPLSDRCAFYQRHKNALPAISRQLKDEYCRQNPDRCARRRVHDRCGNDWVPLEMLPYHHEWAQDILTDVAADEAPLCPQSAAAPDAF